MKKGLLLIILLVIFTTITSGCKKYDKQASIGSVKSIKSGSLERFKDQKWSALAPGAGVFAGDRLRTNDAGHAIFSVENVGRFMIGNNTEFVLGAEPKDFASFLHKGSIWYTSLLAKGSRMNITTPTAVCGARGTAFSVIADDVSTDVCTCEGTVDVTLKNGHAFAVREGQFSVVKKDNDSGAVQDGYQLLKQIRKGDVRWYGICLDCHKDEKHPHDVSLQ